MIYTMKNLGRLAAPAIVGGMAFLAASCGRAVDAAGSGSPRPAARDACTLLSAEELSSGLGSSYSGAAASRNGQDEMSCEYAPGPGNLYPATLTINLKYGKTTMAALRGVGTDLVPGTKAQSDIGDASFYMPLDVGIYVLKGDTLVSLQFGLGKGNRDQKKALLKKVLSRL